MGVIHRIVLVRPGGNAAKGLRIKKLPPPEGGFEHIAVSFATIQTPAADTGLGCNVARSVFRLKRFICIGSIEIHLSLLV
jgi:hypothetical protein